MNENNLNEILDKRGIKQSWLADKAGIQRSTLSNIVNGRHTPNIIVAMKIAKALEVELEDIWNISN